MTGEGVHSIGKMIMTEENSCTWRKICPSDTLSTINPTYTGLGSNPGPRGGKPSILTLSSYPHRHPSKPALFRLSYTSLSLIYDIFHTLHMHCQYHLPWLDQYHKLAWNWKKKLRNGRKISVLVAYSKVPSQHYAEETAKNHSQVTRVANVMLATNNTVVIHQCYHQ
jgi:hypothetical protein